MNRFRAPFNLSKLERIHNKKECEELLSRAKQFTLNPRK